MKGKKISLDSIYNFITLIILMELVLGGLGNLFGYPIRKVLFVVGVLSSIYVIYKEKIKIDIKFIIPIVVVGIYTIYGSIVGLINGNSFSDIFSDANSFLGIIYILLLIAYIKGKNKNVNKMFNIIINCAVIVALITIGLFFFSRLYLPNETIIITKYNWLNKKLQYGLISGLVLSNNYARVYLFNGIFMQLASAVVFIRLLDKNNSKKVSEIVKISILLIAIYVSNTRGFWIGTIGVVLLVLIYYIWRRKKFNLTIKNILIPIIPLIIVSMLISKSIVQPSNNNVEIPQATESIKDRFEAIGDFENDISNKIRAIQFKFLIEKFKEKPVSGWGFGAHINEYSEYMVENGHHAVKTNNFELYYVELLFKTGVIGIAIFFGYLLYNFIVLIKLLFGKVLEREAETNLVGWTIGTMSILASSITNPYIASLSVFFVLVVEVYLIQMYSNK